ncbi:uncharacterized protein V3H82_012159 [Fundulus diaphanus]
MKCFMFCLLLVLPFAVTAVQGQTRAQRRHVLIFLNEALGATTDRATPAKVTAKRNPSDSSRDQDSDDLSEMQSTESFVTPGYPGPDQSGSESKETSEDLNSDGRIAPKPGEKGQASSRRRTRVGTDNMQPLDRTSTLVQDRKSQEQIQGQGKLQGGRGPTDPDSEEGAMARSGRATQSTRLRIKADDVDPDESRETSWQSSEGNDGKPAVVRNSKESREYISSETYPFDPSGLSAPVKSA